MFVAGSIAGASAIASLLELAGRRIPARQEIVLALATAVVVLTIAREIAGVSVPLLQRRWQVPRFWLQRFWIGSFGFGLVMGLGVLTYTPSALFYVYLVACLAIGSVRGALLVGVVYGVAFSAATLVATAAWQGSRAGGQTQHALDLLGRVRVAGALLAPVIIGLPGVWGAL